MEGEQFIAEVRNLAELENNEDARRAIRVTLQTLKERLAGNEPSNLAAQFAPEVSGFVEGNGVQESFSVEEFYERVAQREGGSAPTRPSGTLGRWPQSCRRQLPGVS